MTFHTTCQKNNTDWWGGPLTAATGVEPIFFPRVNTPPPDISKISKEQYFNIQIFENGFYHSGFLKISPQTNKPKITGLMFKSDDPSTLSTFSGTLEPDQDRTWITLNYVGADSLLSTKAVYSTPLKLKNRLSFKYSPTGELLLHATTRENLIHKPNPEVQQLLTGKWTTHVDGQQWTFKLAPVLSNQLSGNIELKSNEQNCNYSVLVTPALDYNAWIFTGDYVSSSKSDCPIRMWRVKLDESLEDAKNSGRDRPNKFTLIGVGPHSKSLEIHLN